MQRGRSFEVKTLMNNQSRRLATKGRILDFGSGA